MASSSHFGNFIGKEIVDYAPNHQTENDEALHQDREQSPIVITLMKKSRTAEDKDQELSFKLPNGWFTDLFIMVEVQNSLGFTKNILWSKLINFTLPDDCVERILGLDEEMKTTRGADCLSLLERLEGWTVERRPRDYLGIYDNFFYHNKSGRFRSFIEVEAYIIHSKFPKDRKPKESSSVVKPSGSASIQKTSVKRETSPKSCSNITEKKRLQAEKFLYEAWRNFSDSSMLEDVPISSTNADEEQVMQILNEARNNLLNGFSSKTDQTETLDNDADEELAQLIADLHQAMQ